LKERKHCSPTRLCARAGSLRQRKATLSQQDDAGGNGPEAAAGRTGGARRLPIVQVQGSDAEEEHRSLGSKLLDRIQTEARLNTTATPSAAQALLHSDHPPQSRGKQASLGTFDNEEEAARARDRMRLWSCKAGGKKEEEVEEELNFPLSDYSDAEVTALQALTQEDIIQKLRRKEERVAIQTSEYTGVSLDKSSGRWLARCQIGSKTTTLGRFGSEEEAARACDRMRLWSCKAHGQKKEEVELNFPLSEYSDDEVTALQGLTQEGVIQKLRRAGKAVERPASPGPVAVKRKPASVGPANFASSQPPNNNRRGTLRVRTKRTYAEMDSDAAAADDNYEDEGDVEEEEEEVEE
jgi:hypothetical protein